MKTKRVIRSWVVYTLIAINTLNVFLVFGEWVNFKLWGLFTLYTMILLTISIKLIKNSKLIKGVWLKITKEKILNLIYDYSQSVLNDTYYDEEFMNEFNVDNVAIDHIIETYTDSLLEYMKNMIEIIEKEVD